MNTETHALQSFTDNELALFKSMLVTLASGNLQKSKALFNHLDAATLSRFRKFRQNFRQLNKAEKLTLFKEEMATEIQ